MNETLANEIGRYRIGRKLRRLRVKKGMSLAELSNHTGLSPALLSKLETAKMVPTVPTLTRIALVFGVGLEHFFSAADSVCEVVRKDDRIRLPADPDAPGIGVNFESLDYPAKDKEVDSYLAVFDTEQDETSLRHKHDGFEFLYVLEGSLRLIHDENVHELSQGDSVYFDASVEHAYERTSAGEARAIIVVRAT